MNSEEECMVHVSIRIPCSMDKKLREIMRKKDYASRSELIRDIIRKYLEERGENK